MVRTTHQHIGAFLLEHGRPPAIDPDGTPWLIQGWLLYYVQRAHQCPSVAIPDRWGYYFEILETHALPERPIPRIDFPTIPRGKGLEQLEAALEILFRHRGSWSSMRLLVEWLGFGLGVHHDPPELDDAIQEELYRTFDLGPLLLEPADYLGALISRRRGNSKAWNPTAFFPTPHSVVEAMVAILMTDVSRAHKDPRLASVCDPCVGTGRMLLHASNHSLVLHGCDIDPLVLLVTRINGALYAPWLAFGLPGLDELTTEQCEQITRDNPRARARLEQITQHLERPPRTRELTPLRGSQLELFDL